MGLTVAVTGATGEVGRPAVEALERTPGVDRVVAMARRPFDPAAHGWTRTEYRQGDVQDPAAVAALVADADVVVHLAFLIMGSRAESARVNLTGSRDVFAATVDAARPRRLVYTSSVAAYGYHRDNPSPLTEDVPARGSDEHYYSQQKAQLEAVLAEVTAGSGLEVYVLRPSIVAGPRATALADDMPWARVGALLPDVVRQGIGAVPGLAPVLPDPGVPLQLVHHDDVASAIAAAVVGRGAPGAYNLAGDGEVTWTEVARAIGARPVPVPTVAVRATSQVITHLPFVPALAEWVHAVRAPVLMDTTKARTELGWRPWHTSRQTLDALARALQERRG